jgi:hypothetical protein
VTNSQAKSPKKISVPAVYVWAAGQKFKASNRQDDLELVNTIFRNSIGEPNNRSYYGQAERERKFYQTVKKSLHQGVIPFEREELDLFLATFIYGQGEQFNLRSDKSWVDPGFLRASGKEISYIDTTCKMIREDSARSELLSQSDKTDILLTLDGLTNESFFYRTVSHDEFILQICGKNLAFTNINQDLPCAISLWNGPKSNSNQASMGQLNRNLGPATIAKDDNNLYLRLESSQTRLEMTAASLVGQWLLIESNGFKSFGALPDLTTDCEQRKIAIDAIQMVKKFTLGANPEVYAPSDVSRYFSKMYPWFIPMDSKNWLNAILL